MSDETNKRWVETTTGIVVVNGVITAVVSSLVTWGITNAASLPWAQVWPVFIIVAVTVLLVISLIEKRLRRLVWGNLARGLRWIGGLRITTKSQRNALEQRGYILRGEEIAQERARAPKPTWRIDARDRFNEPNMFWLNNYGYEVFDVSLTCDPEYFLLDGDVYWEGGFGSNQPGGYIGKWFRGVPTERGATEGVMFHVTWHDRAGDQDERAITFLPEELRAGQEETLAQQFANGRAAGRREALEEQQQAQIEGRPPLPGILPRWHVERATNRDDDFLLRNTVPGSVAKRVRIEGDEETAIRSAGTWDDLTGDANGRFSARISGWGYGNGVTFTVHWYDENHEAHADAVRYLPGEDEPSTEPYYSTEPDDPF